VVLSSLALRSQIPGVGFRKRRFEVFEPKTEVIKLGNEETKENR
jgi:hypothetical protein